MSSDFKFVGLNRVEVKNFKAIRGLHVDIKAVTILAGPNCSGKSSIMQPVLLLKQTLESNRPTPLRFRMLRDRELNVNVTSFDQIKSRLFNTSQNSFEVSVENDVVRSTSVFRQTGDSVELARNSYEFFKKESGSLQNAVDFTLDFVQEMPHDELIHCMEAIYKKINVSYNMPETVKLMVWEDRCFYRILAVRYVHGQLEPISYFGYRPATETAIRWDVQGIIHLPGLRGIPERMYPSFSINGPLYAGTFQDFTASVIEHWGKYDEKNSKNFVTI